MKVRVETVTQVETTITYVYGIDIAL